MRVVVGLGLTVASLLLSGGARAQDAAAGEKVFVQCRACHQIGPGARNTIGPEHNGLVGRKAGSVEGYGYSAAMKTSGLTWDEDTLRDYLRDPKALVPGTKMVFAGLRSDKAISDLLAYLKQFGPDGARTSN